MKALNKMSELFGLFKSSCSPVCPMIIFSISIYPQNEAKGFVNSLMLYRNGCHPLCNILPSVSMVGQNIRE